MSKDGVSVLVKFGVNPQSRRRGGVSDEIHHDFAAKQGTTAPILRDVAKHAMLDLVPLAGSWLLAAEQTRA